MKAFFPFLLCQENTLTLDQFTLFLEIFPIFSTLYYKEAVVLKNNTFCISHMPSNICFPFGLPSRKTKTLLLCISISTYNFLTVLLLSLAFHPYGIHY